MKDYSDIEIVAETGYCVKNKHGVMFETWSSTKEGAELKYNRKDWLYNGYPPKKHKVVPCMLTEVDEPISKKKKRR